MNSTGLLPFSCILLSVFAADLAPAATLSATNLLDGAQNLTTLGGGDWAMYTTTTTPAERKSGGSGIQSLGFAATGALGSANSSQNVQVSWSDGTPSVSNTGTDFNHLISENEDLTPVFTTAVTSSATLNSLYILYGQWNMTSRLTATLSDGSATPIVLDIGGIDDHQTVRIDFASDTAATLNIRIEAILDEGSTNSTLRFQALALSSVPVPEPSAAALLSLGLASLVFRRKR